MENIIYEDELVTEQVFEGDFVLDGHMTLEQQNESIFKMMKDAGIDVVNKSEYRIGYDGASDDNGISETQTSHFVVTRTYKKPVPYKLEREEIYEGVWILDGIRMTPEEQRQKIFEMMRKDGIDVGNEKELEIGYDGVEDDNGISETQTSRFVVYRVHKVKLTKEEKAELEKEDKIQKIYDELVSLREKVRSTSNAKEISALADRIEELSSRLDELVTESTRDYGPFENALKEIETQMKDIQAAISKNMKDYMDSYERIKQLLGDQTSLFKDDMNASEYDKRMEELVREKMAENEESLSIRAEIERQAEALRQLLKKRDRIRKDLKMAEQLGLSALEYKELTDNFRSRKLVNAIIEKKGLGDLVAIPAKDRTPEQKRQIKAIRQEILEELAKAKKEHAESSILNLVEALYGVETQVQLKGKQRVLIVKPKSLENIKKNAAKMPEKIKVTEEVDRSYQPGEAPEDMKEVMERATQEDVQPVIEQFTFFRDERYPDKIFVREAVFDRFNIDEVGPEVRIDGALCYEIDSHDAYAILANQKNDYSPYVVDFENATIEGELEKNPVLERVAPPTDTANVHPVVPVEEAEVMTNAVDDVPVEEPEVMPNAQADVHPVVPVEEPEVMPNVPADVHAVVPVEESEVMPNAETDVETVPPVEEIQETSTADTEGEDTSETSDTEADGEDAPVTSDTEEQDTQDIPSVEENPSVEEDEKMASTETPERVIDSSENDDLIPGTNFKKPRPRGTFETDEEYVQFLQDYYNQIFGNHENEMGSRETDVVDDEDSKTFVKTPVDTPTEEEKENVAKPVTEGTKKPLIDRYTIYRDADEPENLYARRHFFERFDVEPMGPGIRVAGALCYPLSQDDASEIEQNADNHYSPYVIEYLDVKMVHKNDDKEQDKGKEEEPPVVDDGLENRRSIDQIVIYKDTDAENKYYAYKPVFERFDVEPLGEEVRLEGVAGYEISPEDVQGIVANQNNDYSPYVVEFRNISFGKGPIPPRTEPPVVDTDPPVVDTDPPVVDTDPPVVDTDPPKEKIEYITLYRDLNDNNQVYAPVEVLQRFGIKTLASPTVINGVPCHKISRDTDQIIHSIAKMSKNPKLVVRYINVHFKEIEELKPRPHVEEILDKITSGLDIRAKDAKHYRASNLKVSKGFRDELHSGNYVYNIVHIVPAVLKAGVGFFRKLSGKIMTTARAEDAMKTIEDRLAKLTDDELDVLFEEYKGSQLKTDMNNQINPLILDRLRSYGLARVERLNEQIRKDYTALFALLGQIKALEDKIKKSGKETGSLENQRLVLMQQAAQLVKSIIENRNKANNLLSSGVHGIEEDFKAVSTKLSYVGMRFAKSNDFDNDLQHQLGVLGRRLNTALASGDDEAIVQNFMGLESCYFENTEIRGSLAGKRSVGSKYYSPIAEQFDYRDDPFIRDLFTTIAVTSAAVSAINAIRVHQIESQQLLQDQQAQANTVNAQNQATMNYVHQTGQRITDKRGTFQEGMEAQVEQDILTNANTRERAHLDLTDWTFNNAYRAADNAGHAAYNQFNIDVTNQINAVTTDYAQGLITQAQALERMAQISNDAQATLRDVVDSSLQILKPYAATHPQFDLTAVEESMEYIVAHPNAIADMNQAIVEVTNLADGLQGLQAMPMVALGSLPSDMASTLVCAASACMLATNVSASMSKAGQKGTYGNEITDMMEDYLSSAEEADEHVRHI